MPRVECYVADPTYIKLLTYKQMRHHKTIGKSGAECITQFFSIKHNADATIDRLNKARDQMQESYEQQIRQLKLKIRELEVTK